MGNSDVSRRLAHSRWRRLPGVFRSGQRQEVGPGDEPERLTLYLPARELDLATSLAAEKGFSSTQSYCESLLRQALQAAAEARRPHDRKADDPQRSAAMEGLNAIANDLDYLAEWSQSRVSPDDDPPHAFLAASPRPGPEPIDDPNAVPIPRPVEIHLGDLEEPYRVVLYHAALDGEPPPALLASLRAGIAVEIDAAHELIAALYTLQDRLQGATALDRRLAFALHRLALESQILLTETWPGLAGDPLQTEILRRLQDHIDGLFAGQPPSSAPPASAVPPTPDELAPAPEEPAAPEASDTTDPAPNETAPAPDPDADPDPDPEVPTLDATADAPAPAEPDHDPAPAPQD